MNFRLIILLSVLFCGNATAQSRFTDVEWNIKTGIAGNSFQVTMTLITKRGKKVTVDPVYNSVKWNTFRFECPDLEYFHLGEGRYKIDRSLMGKDSIRVTAVSEKYGLQSSFNIPVLRCKELQLNNPSVEYGATAPLEWAMVMNNGQVWPIDPKWVDLSLLENQSDPIISFTNGVLSLLTVKPVERARVKLIHKQTGDPVIDYELEVRYPSHCILDFSGMPGRDGRSGTGGSQTGESGKSGESGENGGNAESLTVFIRPYADETFRNLLEVTVVTEKHRRRRIYLSDNDAQIDIVATGGKGGSGGHGGNGNHNALSEDLVKGGNAGHGGNGGHGGTGGDVLIIVPEDLLQPERLVNVINTGGTPGKGGHSGEPGSGSTSFRYDNGNKGAEGQPGYEGKPGAFIGFRSLHPDAFTKALNEAGW